MLRSAILLASRNRAVRGLVSAAPVSRGVVDRFVAGEDLEDAVRVTRRLVTEGLSVSLDHLGEDTTDAGSAERQAKAYVVLLERLAAEGLAPAAEVSVKLTAVGLAVDPALAADNVRRICAAAREAGTTVTVDMEDHTTTDATLETVAELRRDFPGTGAVIQAYLRRSEADCRALAVPGSRVRLCKGAYSEPESVAFQTRQEVDRSYVRCLAVLLRGGGYPMVATHDPRLVDIAGSMAARLAVTPDRFEYQMLFGVRPREQQRLRALGRRVRIYTPFGTEWYGYLMRRLAERPANVGFFLRALASRS